MKKKVRMEFKSRLENGENNLKIKYFNSIPKIIYIFNAESDNENTSTDDEENKSNCYQQSTRSTKSTTNSVHISDKSDTEISQVNTKVTTKKTAVNNKHVNKVINDSTKKNTSHNKNKIPVSNNRHAQKNKQVLLNNKIKKKVNNNIHKNNNSKCFSLCYQNVQSIVNKYDEFIENINLSVIEYDIIVFTETWCKDKDTDRMFGGINYNIYRCDTDVEVKPEVVVYLH